MLREALKRLEESAAAQETDITRDSTIQRFEFTFELAWKAMQLYLEHQGLESGSPREAIKNAFQRRIIAHEQDADQWFQMLDDRNLTSHTYQEKTSREIFRRICTVYIPLLRTVTEILQTLSWE